MVNHFRTLILNQPPNGDGSELAEYIPRNFSPLRLEPEEEAVRKALLGENTTRRRQEFLSTLIFRLIIEFGETRVIAEEVDPRVTFNPRDPVAFRPNESYAAPADLTLTDLTMTLAGEGVTLGKSTVVEGSFGIVDKDAEPVPPISQIWSSVRNLPGLRRIFTSQGIHRETLEELYLLMDTLKRDDQRLAVMCCAYALRLTERL